MGLSNKNKNQMRFKINQCKKKNRHPLLRSHLFNVKENINDVPNAPRCLFDFGRQTNATHCRRFHAVAHKRFGIVKSLEQNLSGGHGHLWQLQQYAGRLNEFTAQNAQIDFRLPIEPIVLGRCLFELIVGQQTIFQCQNDFAKNSGI